MLCRLKSLRRYFPLSTRGNEILNIVISSLRCRGKARRPVPLLNRGNVSRNRRKMVNEMMMECPNNKFLLPNQLCAGYSVKLKKLVARAKK